MKNISSDDLDEIKSGVYLLEIFAEKQFKINVKKFNKIIFPAGYYYYAGSAQKSLDKRIKRHFRQAKNLHWHIDHITTKKEIQIQCVIIFPGYTKETESRLANSLEGIAGIKITAHGFGNSDTKDTKTHLFHSKRRLNHSHFSDRYHSTVRFIPSSSENSGV
ncbi:MAG: GIY-YIG nuclease family protein [Melioribacteraceae bacterium]|nr:GIY-YIG nuclease family protein [Melioribacteraceae bacterium]